MNKLLSVSAIILMLLFSCTLVFGQATSKGDTLIIGPLNSAGQPLGALNEYLKADTLADGTRAHKVYKLNRGAQYILTEVINIDQPLVLVADKPDDSNRPPIIRCGIKEDGGAVDLWWNIFSDATFKNLWLSGINLDGNGPISWIAQAANGSGHSMTYEGCIVEYPYTYWALFADWSGMNNYYIRDCIFQYVGNPSGTTWNGAIFHTDNSDTVIIQNTTFFDFGCFAVRGAFYEEVDHCTFVNSVVHPMDNHRQVIKKFTNNLLVNCHAFSDDQDEIKRHFDVEVKGLMNYAEIQWDPQALDSLYGPGGVYGKTYDPNGDGHLTVDELYWELKNNNWFYTSDITDYWAQFPQVTPNPWMNNYNKAMFAHAQDAGDWTWDLKKYIWADSAGNIIDNPGGGYDTLHVVDSTIVTQTHKPFKFFKEENTMNLEPGIVDDNNTGALLAQNCINIRNEWAGQSVTHIKWHNVDDYLAFTWPLDYDLSYSNATLKTAGTDGKPVGSLQWWDMEYTAIDAKPEATPGKYALNQNYPNPFNPTTTLSFSIPQADKVTLEVFNVLGQKVATVVNNQTLKAGAHLYQFDGSDLASGVYFYKISVGNKFQSAKKMMILK